MIATVFVQMGVMVFFLGVGVTLIVLCAMESARREVRKPRSAELGSDGEARPKV